MTEDKVTPNSPNNEDSNGKSYPNHNELSESITIPELIALRLEQVDSIINQLSSKIDSGTEQGLNSPNVELSPQSFYCEVPESWPKDIQPNNYLLCDRMQIPCLQFPSRILCSKWHQLHGFLSQELTSVVRSEDFPQSYDLRMRYWENEILPLVKCSFYDSIYNVDKNLIPFTYNQDQSENHKDPVLTIYPQNDDEIKTYNNKKYEWFQKFEMTWLQKYTGSNLSYLSLISDLKLTFDSILTEHFNPSFPVIKVIDEYLLQFKELVSAFEKYEPELLTLDRNVQIIQNFTSFYIFRQVPDLIGFLEELKNNIENHPSKTREIITKAYNRKKSLAKSPSKPKIESLFDIWEGEGDSVTSYNRVIRYYQTKNNYDFDKPLINQDGSWTRGKASKSFLQAFIKACINIGHVRDSYSSAELARVLKNTFKLNSLSPTGYTSQNLELLDDKYLEFFSDMPD